MTIEIAEQRQVMIDLQTGRSRPVMPQAPLLSSARSAWKGVMLEQHAGLAIDVRDIAIPDHALFLQLTASSVCELRVGDDRVRALKVLPGQIGLFPAMTPVSARTLHSGDFVSVTLDPRFLLCVAHELVHPSGLELNVRLGYDDPMLRACILALQREAQSAAPGGRLYAESVATAIAAHLVRHHARQKPAPIQGRGRLSRRLLSRAIEFMQEHLGEDISLSSLSEAVGLSPYYFSRLFKETTGCTPHQYLIQCRVHRAKELLLVADISLSQVAVRVGFCDQSHFSAHFKRVYGLTPREFVRRAAGKRSLPA